MVILDQLPIITMEWTWALAHTSESVILENVKNKIYSKVSG